MLPMAIRQDTIVAIRKNEAEKVLRIANVNDAKYSMCTYPADPDQVDPQLMCLSFFVNNTFFICTTQKKKKSF